MMGTFSLTRINVADYLGGCYLPAPVYEAAVNMVRGSGLDESALRAGVRELQILLALQSHQPANNSLSEYLSYQALEPLLMRRHQSRFDDFLVLIGSRPRIEDVMNFVPSPLQWLLERRRAAVFQHPEYTYKNSELDHSWTEELLRSGFRQETEAIQAAEDLDRVRRVIKGDAEAKKAEASAWKKYLDEERLRGASLADKGVVLGLLRFFAVRVFDVGLACHQVIQDLMDDIERDRARVRVVSAKEMMARGPIGARTVNRSHVHAVLSVPEEGVPEIVHVDPRERFCKRTEEENLGHFAAVVIHEGVHLAQEKRRPGENWLVHHGCPAELEAFPIGAAMEFFCGLDLTFRQMARLHPSHRFMMGLRNYLEQIRDRGLPCP